MILKIGTALLIDYDISIDNQNIISGGGGGGGGSGAGRYLYNYGSVWNWIDGLGGGGGWPYGAAGSSTLITVGAASPTPTPATPANATNAGLGGTGSVITGGTAFSIVVGDGGNGGKYASGIAGANAVVTTYVTDQPLSIVQQSGAAGGSLGDAIHGTSFITWVNMGTIYGATS